MKNSFQAIKLSVLAAALPFIYGCGGAGGGAGSLLGFLFGSSGGGLGGGGEIALLGSSAGSSGASSLLAGGANVATFVNPEPASMLLLGSGLMAMSYFKSKIDRKSK